MVDACSVEPKCVRSVQRKWWLGKIFRGALRGRWRPPYALTAALRPNRLSLHYCCAILNLDTYLRGVKAPAAAATNKSLLTPPSP